MSRTTKKPARGDVSQEELELVLGYLQKQNRPYNVTDLVNNLHNAVGKTGISKVLEKLVAEGEVVEKTYGKQSVYVIRQDDPTYSSQDLEEMDVRIGQLKELEMRQREEYRILQAELNRLESQPTLEELKEHLEARKMDHEQIQQRLGETVLGNRVVDLDKKRELETQYRELTKTFRHRKGLCMEIVNTISEGLSLKPQDLVEELGFEADQ